MVSKCANPSCSAEFRYLHQGKLFLLTSNRPGEASESDTAQEQSRYAWLCDNCAQKYRVKLDELGNIILAERNANAVSAI